MHEQSADSFTIHPRLVIVYLVTRMLCNDHDISVYVLKLQKTGNKWDATTFMYPDAP